MSELDYQKISEFEKRLKENPEAGQAFHLAMKAFVALELMKEGFDIKLEKATKGRKMRFDIVGKKNNAQIVIECATHRKDVERAVDKVRQLPAEVRKILVTPKETLQEISFDVEKGKIDVKEHFDEIWIPQIDFNLTCSEGSSNYPATLQMYFSSGPFIKEAGYKKTH